MAEWFIWEDLPIRVDRQGMWRHGDTPLHPRVARLFCRNLQADSAGTYRIVLGRAQHVVSVADTPFFARSVRLSEAPHGRGLASIHMRVCDDTEEEVDPATLMQGGPDGALYCRIERRGFCAPCRFTPAQYHEIALHAQFEGDRIVLPVAGRAYALAPYDPKPFSLR